MSSSSSVAARAPFGVGKAGFGGEPSSFSPEELAFARRVRTPWWQSCAPLLETLLFGIVLVVAAAVSGPTPTVQRMLDADQNRTIAEARARDSERGAEYVLPAHWQQMGSTPAAESAGPGAALDCDPSGAGAPS
jgi:hypothetical protein